MAPLAIATRRSAPLDSTTKATAPAGTVRSISVVLTVCGEAVLPSVRTIRAAS